jgi:hypothetical protein
MTYITIVSSPLNYRIRMPGVTRAPSQWLPPSRVSSSVPWFVQFLIINTSLANTASMVIVQSIAVCWTFSTRDVCRCDQWHDSSKNSTGSSQYAVHNASYWMKSDARMGTI